MNVVGKGENDLLSTYTARSKMGANRFIETVGE